MHNTAISPWYTNVLLLTKIFHRHSLIMPSKGRRRHCKFYTIAPYGHAITIVISQIITVVSFIADDILYTLR